MAKVSEAELTDFVPDPDNANLGTERGQAMIEDSIREDGAARSIVIDADNVIVAGSKTHQGAIDAGLEKAVIVEVRGDELVVVKRTDFNLDDDDGRARRYAYRDNRSGELNLTWDAEQLLTDLGADVDLSGLFTDIELEAILGEAWVEAGEAPEAQMDRASELQEVWQVERGQIWEIPSKTVEGQAHRLMCGDSTNDKDTETLVSQPIALCVTSPPYPGADMWQLEDEEPEARIDRLNSLNHDVLQVAWETLMDGGVACWIIQDVPWGNHGIITTTTTTTAVKELGYSIRGCIVWDKGIPHLPAPAFMRRPCVPNLTHENILVLFKGDWIPREKQTGLSSEAKAWLAEGVWRIGTESAKMVGHIAPFPIELPKRCIELFSLEGDLIIDWFLGSGTTIVACEQTGRIGYGMDIESKWCAVTLQRLADMGLEPKLLE